jgi:5'-deoxynucleotidase YfbR-like HD superfamily hydrolase
MRYVKECIRTFSGLAVDPYHLQPEDVKIEDIAHSLAMQTRANGHFPIFYSVAQHSINCALEAKNRGEGRRTILACLLHDAAEAYIADIPRPVKLRLKDFGELEDAVEKVIFSVFGLLDLTPEERDVVRQIDDAMLYCEFEAISDLKVFETAPYISMAHDFNVRDIAEVEREFIRLLKQLTASGQ